VQKTIYITQLSSLANGGDSKCEDLQAVRVQRFLALEARPVTSQKKYYFLPFLYSQASFDYCFSKWSP